MSSDIFVKVMRANVQIYPRVYLQKDNLSVQEASYYGGVAPYQRFQCYTLTILDLRQGDLLIDLSNINPVTGTNTQYRIINTPEPFPDCHMELVVDLMRGT